MCLNMPSGHRSRLKTGVLIIKAVVSFLLVSAVASLSWAQSLEEQRLQSQTKYNFLNDLTLDSNTQKVSAKDSSSGLTYTLGVKYKIDKKSSLWGFLRGSKRFSGEERLDLLDTIVRYERSLGTWLKLKNRLRVSAILPTNDHNHETTSFVGGVSAQLRSGLSLNKSIYANLVNTLRWNFHEYRVSELAGINIQSTLSSSVNLSYTVMPKLVLSSAMGLRLAKTYENNIKNSYNFDLSASYSVTDKLSVGGGYGVNASLTKADGRSSNLRLFDERDAGYYVNLSHFY